MSILDSARLKNYIFLDKVRLRAATANPLAEREFVEYRADSALRALVDAGCAQAGLERRICCEVDTIADLVEIVAHGIGVSCCHCSPCAPPPIASST